MTRAVEKGNPGAWRVEGPGFIGDVKEGAEETLEGALATRARAFLGQRDKDEARGARPG